MNKRRPSVGTPPVFVQTMPPHVLGRHATVLEVRTGLTPLHLLKLNKSQLIANRYMIILRLKRSKG